MKYTNLIDFDDLNERIAFIEESKDSYISENGNVYKKIEDKYYLRAPYQNKLNGYMYCTITTNLGKKTYRVHRLVAQAFVSKDNENHDIVMHIDNDKTNNNYLNLKWGTVSENTKQAFDDGLAVNDKGYNDSQSHPVNAYDLNMNLITSYGSVCIASRELGISKSTISRQCQGISTGKPRCGYYFRYQENI